MNTFLAFLTLCRVKFKETSNKTKQPKKCHSNLTYIFSHTKPIQTSGYGLMLMTQFPIYLGWLSSLILSKSRKESDSLFQELIKKYPKPKTQKCLEKDYQNLICAKYGLSRKAANCTCFCLLPVSSCSYYLLSFLFMFLKYESPVGWGTPSLFQIFGFEYWGPVFLKSQTQISDQIFRKLLNSSTSGSRQCESGQNFSCGYSRSCSEKKAKAASMHYESCSRE